jgi:hypothetical protein
LDVQKKAWILQINAWVRQIKIWISKDSKFFLGIDIELYQYVTGALRRKSADLFFLEMAGSMWPLGPVISRKTENSFLIFSDITQAVFLDSIAGLCAVNIGRRHVHIQAGEPRSLKRRGAVRQRRRALDTCVREYDIFALGSGFPRPVLFATGPVFTAMPATPSPAIRTRCSSPSPRARFPPPGVRRTCSRSPAASAKREDRHR